MTSVYIEDVAKGWWGKNKVEEMLVSLSEVDANMHGGCEISIPQDPGSAGKVVKSAYVALLHGHIVECTPESGEKEVRAGPLASQVEAHNVYLVKGPWNADFVAEAASFPRGRLKDQLDAASRAYGRLIKRRVLRVPAAPQIIGIKR
jgi:predicted phage terminase large subunit-like protein